jgi:enterochelin esterase family protein
MKFRTLTQLTIAMLLIAIPASTAFAQTPAPPQKTERPAFPARDPHTPGYAVAKELPDGEVPPAYVDGNFIIGPTHTAAPEMFAQDGTLQGRVIEFTMNSSDSKIYPGIAREPNTFGTPDPTDPAKLVVTTSHPAPYTRKVFVYIPKQYVPGTVAPFIVGPTG